MAEALAALVAMREVSKPANSWLTFIIDDHSLDLDCNCANFFVQLSVTATLAAQTTEESQLMTVRKSEDPAEPMRAVEDVASSTDIAVLLAGKTTIHFKYQKELFSDKHSDSEKQASHGWGATEGNAELADEEAGEAIAKTEQKEALTGEAADGEAAEPEDHSISYADYLAQLAEKKLQLGTGIPEARKPNEGSKQDKKWANAKPIVKDEEEDFVAGSGGKAKRERERKQKQILEIDQRFVEAPERGGRGGFRGRGGRGDGAPRGGRGEGFRGGRGDGSRGGRGRGDGPHRGGPRGPRGNAAPINTNDPSAFPSLGAA
jgi:hypothetical protein